MIKGHPNVERALKAIQTGSECSICAYMGDSGKVFGFIYRDGKRHPVCARHAEQVRRVAVAEREKGAGT